MAEHLSPLDATFLELEEADETAHMHIGAVCLFDAPPAGVPALEALRAQAAHRIHALPRYAQRLSEPHTGGLSWPAWVRHEHFDIADHISQAVLPAPGGRAELCEWAAEYWSHRLDRRLPLWEIVLVTGLEHGRFAFVTKTHHALVDGVGSVEAGHLLLDAAPEGSPAPGSAPASSPVGERGHDRVAGLAAVPRWAAGAVRAGADLALHPDRLRELAAKSTAAVDLVVRDEVVGAPHTSLNVPIGTRRRFHAVTVPLDDVKAIKRALGGTVNDVVLAVASGGLRRLFLERGETPPARGLRAMVPVNVRPDGAQLGNHVASLFVHLPVGAETPGERYEEAMREAEALKSGRQAEGSSAVVNVAGLAPPVLHSFLARSLFGSRLFNVTVTNIPGPPMPLWAFGGQMREIMPLVPLAAEHGVGIAIISYHGTLTFGVVGDRETVPDLELVADGIRESLAELGELAGAAVRA